MPEEEKDVFLFSVDVEDVRSQVHGGDAFRAKVPDMIERYLLFLRTRNMKATFFVVGEVARAYPDMIKSLVDDGHEIGCHGNRHLPLIQFDKSSFQDDIEKNLEHLYKTGAKDVSGFRAPVFSLTEKTIWAYEVLKELGFSYSSSVLPAKSPLFGWPDFGLNFRPVASIWEMPVSLLPFGRFTIPFAGGVYFRALPCFLLKYFFRQHFEEKRPIVGYFHPYDIDTEQERFMHPGIGNNHFFNFLMYYNRGTLLKKLDKLLDTKIQIIPYIDYVNMKLSCQSSNSSFRA